MPILSPDVIAPPQRSYAKGYAVDKGGTDRPSPFASLLSGQTDKISAAAQDHAAAPPAQADDPSRHHPATAAASPAVSRTPGGVAKSTAKSIAESKVGPNRAAAATGEAAAKSGSVKEPTAPAAPSMSPPSAADSSTTGSTESSATGSRTTGSPALDALAADQSATNGSARDAPANAPANDAASQMAATPDPSSQMAQPPVAAQTDATNLQAVAAIMIPAPAAAGAVAGSATAGDGGDPVAIADAKAGGAPLPSDLALPPAGAAAAAAARDAAAGLPPDTSAITREQPNARASAPDPSAALPAFEISPTDATANAVPGLLPPAGDGAIQDGRPRNLGAPASSAANAALGVPLQTANLAITTVRAKDAAGAVPLADVAVTIAAQVQSGKSRFDIRLDPPELGRIEVQLNFDRGGNVSSRLIVERPETLDLLRRDAPQLERALQDAGLNTGNGMQFSLADQGFASRNWLAATDDYSTRAPLGMVADESAPAAGRTGSAASSRRRGGLDITV